MYVLIKLTLKINFSNAQWLTGKTQIQVLHSHKIYEFNILKNDLFFNATRDPRTAFY